jgi:Spy/CpxP family protein refolding chaperone
MKKAIVYFMVSGFVMLSAFGSMAQRRPAPRQQSVDRPVRQERLLLDQGQCLAIEGLSEAQQEAISALRTKRLEQGVQHRAQMDALRARKNELMVQASPDMARVNALIDEMESLRSAHLKEAAAHRQDVRALLTDEQRARFDSQASRPMGRGGRGQAARPGRMHRMR